MPWTGFDAADQAKGVKLANARLIAAAPELLAALQQITEAYAQEKRSAPPMSDAIFNARRLIRRVCHNGGVQK